jgi:hypothetical protein
MWTEDYGVAGQRVPVDRVIWLRKCFVLAHEDALNGGRDKLTDEEHAFVCVSRWIRSSDILPGTVE